MTNGGPVASLPGGRTSVLIVEDDLGIATQLVRGLRRDGYDVDHVTTGGEALRWGEPDVVLARIRAVLRRVHPGGELLTHGPLTVDLRTRKVTVSGREVALTPKEFDILECLAADPGRVLSRQQILESAWDAHWYGPTKVLDVHVGALRRKLGVPGLIETVYGRGFRLGGA